MYNEERGPAPAARRPHAREINKSIERKQTIRLLHARSAPRRSILGSVSPARAALRHCHCLGPRVRALGRRGRAALGGGGRGRGRGHGRRARRRCAARPRLFFLLFLGVELQHQLFELQVQRKILIITYLDCFNDNYTSKIHNRDKA